MLLPVGRGDTAAYLCRGALRRDHHPCEDKTLSRVLGLPRRTRGVLTAVDDSAARRLRRDT